MQFSLKIQNYNAQFAFKAKFEGEQKKNNIGFRIIY